MSDLIKILNPNIAKELQDMGFQYMKEKANGKDVFVFIASPQIITHLSSRYSREDFFMCNKLSF